MSRPARRSLTVQAGVAAGVGLLLEVTSRVLDHWDLVADSTTDVLRLSGQGLVALAVPALVYGLRRALGAGNGGEQ